MDKHRQCMPDLARVFDSGGSCSVWSSVVFATGSTEFEWFPLIHGSKLVNGYLQPKGTDTNVVLSLKIWFSPPTFVHKSIFRCIVSTTVVGKILIFHRPHVTNQFIRPLCWFSANQAFLWSINPLVDYPVARMRGFAYDVQFDLESVV